MKFRFLFSRLANFFFFLHTLSDWHPSCRQEYEQWWKQQIEITSQHQKSLFKLKNILTRHWKDNGSFLGTTFFLSPDPFPAVKSLLSTNEFNTLKEGFFLFEDSFNRIYRADEPLLKEWAETLTRSFNVKQEYRNILEMLQILYHIDHLPKQVNVYLTLCSPPKDSGGGGGSVWDSKLLWIEISRMPRSAYTQMLGILFHEFIHFIFEKEYFRSLVRTHSRQSLNLHEVTSTSLFPRGILAQHILHVPPPPLEYYRYVSSSSVPKLLTLVEQYIKARKPFDEMYIKQLAEIVKPNS